MELGGEVGARGSLGTKVMRGANWRRTHFWSRWSRRLSHAKRVLAGEAGVIYAELSARHYVAAEDRWIDKGVVCRKLVTDEFVALIVDELQASLPAHTRFGDFKFHDSGVGTTDPAVTDVAIETTDGESRVTGTQVEGATADIYKSVGTIAYTTTKAITEHGLFDAASGADELMDRSEFAVINVVSGDSIEFTFSLTMAAGG